MSAEPAVRFARVWKSYPRWPSGTRTLRAIVTRRVPLLGREGRTWALSDVSFDIARGSSLGIIGPNGAGKSTLLRLAAGLGRAARGEIHVPGDAAAVLSLGDTLDATLSGRENALTAALVDGWSLDQAKALLPKVAEFSELAEQFDAPVRTYSDGMRVRLAFAVVAQARPQVLLVDEVISVGDLAFQARCAETIRAMRAAGTTLVLASHDLGLVESECEQALWLDHGEQRMLGPASEVVEAYRTEAHARVVAMTPSPSPEALGGRLELRKDRLGTQQVTIDDMRIDSHPDGVAMTLALTNHGEPVDNPIVQVKIADAASDTVRLETSTRDAGKPVGRLADSVGLSLTVSDRDLPPGDYVVDVGVYSADWGTTFDYHWHAYGFTVVRDSPRPPHWDVRTG